MTVKAGVNKQAIREAVAAIEASEEHHDPKTPHWNQLDWAFVATGGRGEREEAMCGTAMCLAGWAVYLDEGEQFWKRLRKSGLSWTFKEGAGQRSIAVRAATIFGLDWGDPAFCAITDACIDTLDELKATITEHLGIEW